MATAGIHASCCHECAHVGRVYVEDDKKRLTLCSVLLKYPCCSFYWNTRADNGGTGTGHVDEDHRLEQMI